MKTPQTMTRSSACGGGDRPVGHAVGDGLGDGVLRRAEHLDGLLHPLDRHLGDQDRRRLGDQVGRQHGQQVGVPGRLVGQRVGEGEADRPVFRPISRSMWAISFPSPTRASPMFMMMSLAMSRVLRGLVSVVDPAAGIGVSTRPWQVARLTNCNESAHDPALELRMIDASRLGATPGNSLRIV